jgi:hypothetical protein
MTAVAAGIVYRIVEWFLTVLPVDASGRRVFDETLADWRREAGKATNQSTAVIATLRSLLSVARSVAGVSARDVIMIRQSSVWSRVLLWTCGYLALVNLVRFAVPGGWQHSALSRLYGSIQLIAYFLPVALLLAIGLGSQRRHVPALGLSLVATLLAFFLLGWGVPIANRAYYEANPLRFVSQGQQMAEGADRPLLPRGQMLAWVTAASAANRVIPYSPISFVSDETVTQKIRKVVGGRAQDGWYAIQWLNFFGAYVSLCALIPISSGALRRQRHIVRYVFIGATAGLLLYQRGIQTSLGAESVLWWFGIYWVPVAWLMAWLPAINWSTAPIPEITNSQ